MNKRTSRYIGKPFATLGAKFAACALSASLYSLGMLGGSVALTETAYAQSTCTGGHFNCVTYIKGSWQNQSSPNVQTTVRISDFRFNEPISGYPVTSSSPVSRDTNTVALTITFGTTGAPRSIDINIRPNSNLVWNATHGGFTLRPSAGGSNTEHVVLKFRIATTEQSCNQGGRVGQQGVTIQGSTPSAGKTIHYGLRVCTEAVIISQSPGQIQLPTVPIFDLTFGGVAVGQVSVAGNSIIVPPAPPAPKTCNSVNGTTRNLDLGKIAVTDLNNNTRQNPKNDTFNLVNCPAGVRLRLTLEDVNSTASTQNYLTNSLTGDAAAANAGIQLIFEGDANPKRMKTSWTRTGANTANATNPINYTARFFHIGGNLKPGKINSAAKLTIEYP